MPQGHLPGQSAFRSVLPEDIDWKPFPASRRQSDSLSWSASPQSRGPYLIRVKVPHGVKLMPHKHPEDRSTP